MCLGEKLSDRSLKRYKAKGKKLDYIWVWKVVRDTGKKYLPEFKDNRQVGLFRAGLNKARTDAEDENQLIHAFRDKSSAEEWYDPGQEILECLVAPDWVLAIGKTTGGKLALTTKAIVMPEYPKKKVTVREFRAAIKGKKVKKYSWEH